MSSPPPHPDATVSTRLLTRIVTALVALWTLAAGLVLLAFHGASSSALGAGITDEAGQRLVGAHLLVLVPAYLLLVLRPDRYRAFLWLPLVAQLAVVLVVGYNIITGVTAFRDGVLPVAVGVIFAALLGFVWITEQRETARAKASARLDSGSSPAEPGPNP